MIKIQCDVCGLEVDKNALRKDGRPYYFDFYTIPVGGGPGLFPLDEETPYYLPLCESGICFCNKCAMEIAQWGSRFIKSQERNKGDQE